MSFTCVVLSVTHRCGTRAGLSYVTDLRDKAVAEPCMHAFCVACLSQWLKLKRSCPLCKACPGFGCRFLLLVSVHSPWPQQLLTHL